MYNQGQNSNNFNGGYGPTPGMAPAGGSMPPMGMPNQMQGQMPGQMSGQMQGRPMPNQMSGQMPNPMPAQMAMPSTEDPFAQGARIDHRRSLIKTVVIVVLSLLSVAFIVLFVWMYSLYNDAHTDLQSQIDQAVATAVKENTDNLQNQFNEAEKNPNSTYAGPSNYGSITFSYPKTWSVYQYQSSEDGGEFSAVFNPNVVKSTEESEINALRFTILTQPFDQVNEQYASLLENEENPLGLENVTLKKADTSAVIYTGTLPSELYGKVCIFTVRDKTVILQTDAKVFFDDFQNVLDSLTFVK